MILQLLKTVAVLAAVLALIVAFAYLARRLKLAGGIGETGNDGWRILGIKHLGPRRQIVVLEVGSRLLLLGSSERGVSSLMEISDPAETEKIRSALGRRKRTVASFQDFLRRAES